MSFDPTPWRRETAAALAGRIHLNNAGAALMPQPVLEAVTAHLQLEVQLGGYEAADAAHADIEDAYEAVAALTGSSARNVAIVENATVAFAQALSAFAFEPGDVLLTTRNDYISNQLMYLSLARRHGVEIVRAGDRAEGGADLDSVRDLLQEHRPRLAAVTWVPTNSGLIQPVAEIGELCAEHDVPYLIDACQAVGQIQIDVQRLKCDFLSATARKFLRGPRGIGFLHVSDRMLQRQAAPLWIDMRGARWTEADEYELADSARRFENWEFAYALVVGLGAAARYALKCDVAVAGAYAAQLASYARDRLTAMPRARVLDRGERLAAIVTVEIEGHDAATVVERLREEAINTSATFRDYAVLDMDDKRARSALRISPHYYNTRREIDILLSALEEFTGEA
ncbi:MAG TPA: aminotransferase class V-fold PLP-dependent enzyme [Longimicrobiales bacterium]|nr:aminotransferase class V-fold PLP-dependent enzyme [Longimicrobiales bacterium]